MKSTTNNSESYTEPTTTNEPDNTMKRNLTSKANELYWSLSEATVSTITGTETTDTFKTFNGNATVIDVPPEKLREIYTAAKQLQENCDQLIAEHYSKISEYRILKDHCRNIITICRKHDGEPISTAEYKEIVSSLKIQDGRIGATINRLCAELNTIIEHNRKAEVQP